MRRGDLRAASSAVPVAYPVRVTHTTEPETYDFPVLSAVVTDGDTYHLEVLVRPARSAFRVSCGEDRAVPEVRLDGWDCPEKRSSATRKITPAERYAAQRAELLAVEWFRQYDGRVRVTTEPDPEKYGRWLGRPYAVDAAGETVSTLGASLSLAKLAVPYRAQPGDKRWFEVFVA